MGTKSRVDPQLTEIGNPRRRAVDVHRSDGAARDSRDTAGVVTRDQGLVLVTLDGRRQRAVRFALERQRHIMAEPRRSQQRSNRLIVVRRRRGDTEGDAGVGLRQARADPERS